MSPRERYIRIRARQLGLDPSAVIADSLGEGAAALRGGNSIGDHGTSFGPFQLHIGGALPGSVASKGSAYANNWANSKQGIDYALHQMLPYAQGKSGKEALAGIVSGFERPADIPGQIAARSQYLGKSGGSAVSGVPAHVGIPGSPETGLSSSALRSMAASTLLQQSMATAMGAAPDQTGLMALALARRQQNAAASLPGPGSVDVGGLKVHGVNPMSPHDANAVQAIKHYIGTPYEWGGTDPSGFDCSGLLQYVWKQQGVNIPRTTYDQWKVGQQVGRGRLRAGDAVFFQGSDSKGGLPGHVGMYIGGGKFVEAPHTGAKVQISSLAGRSDFVGARRYA